MYSIVENRPRRRLCEHSIPRRLVMFWSSYPATYGMLFRNPGKLTKMLVIEAVATCTKLRRCTGSGLISVNTSAWMDVVNLKFYDGAVLIGLIPPVFRLGWQYTDTLPLVRPREAYHWESRAQKKLPRRRKPKPKNLSLLSLHDLSSNTSASTVCCCREVRCL